MASTLDFCFFQFHGLIFCPETKDVVLFPGRIGGRYYALHRPTTAHDFCRPEIWLASSPDLLHWGKHQPWQIRSSGEQILAPELAYECEGFVPNVVFATGINRQEGSLLICAGAADSFTCVVELQLAGLLLSGSSPASAQSVPGPGAAAPHPC